MPDKKPKYSMASNAFYMLEKAWRYRKSVIGLCLIQIAAVISLRLLNLFVAPTVLQAIEDASPLSYLLGLITVFALSMTAVGAIGAYVDTNTLFGRVAVRLAVVSDIHDKFCRTSYPNTGDQSFLKLSETAQKIVGGNSEATEACWDTFQNLFVNILGFIIYLTMLTVLDPVIIAVTLITTITGYFFSKRIRNWEYLHREEEQEYSHQINYINGKASSHIFAKDIRIFGMRPWLEDVYNRAYRMYQAFHAKAQRIYIWANVIDILLAFLRNGVAYGYLITLTLRGGLGAAQFLLYFTAVDGFTTWISGILTQFIEWHRQSLEISSLREFLDYPEPFRFEEGRPLALDSAKQYGVTLKDVSFRYPGADEDTIHHLNLTIQPGEKLAVVGLNGAGKTTLVKLICGFYDPTEGQVLLNGEDIRQYNRRDYYKLFSAVFQDFSLLAGTVAGNVAQAEMDIDMDKVKSCIEKAGLAEMVLSLPEGVHTNLGKEVYEDAPDLSGGQLQRLMLARALYKESAILLLDEPTAALDSLAESDLYQKYNAFSEGKTSIFISHRLASTRFCNRIILVIDGRIAEEGTHDQLLKKGGEYARLFEVQSRYYKEGEIANEA